MVNHAETAEDDREGDDTGERQQRRRVGDAAQPARPASIRGIRLVLDVGLLLGRRLVCRRGDRLVDRNWLLVDGGRLTRRLSAHRRGC
jgi:hypothetical protein